MNAFSSGSIPAAGGATRRAAYAVVLVALGITAEGRKEVTWRPGNLPSGTYTVCLYDSKDQLLDTQKAVYLP